MTDPVTRTDYPLLPPGPDRPEWLKKVSQDIRELAAEAERILARIGERFGPDAFRNARFAQAYFVLAKARRMTRVFEVVYGRAIRAREVSEFERRFQASIEAAGSRSLPGMDSVPIELAYYLPQSVEQAKAEKEGGLLPDPTPAALLIDFAMAVLEDAGLSAFRVDQSGEPSSWAEVNLVGRVFAAYHILELLGSGGFAQVYRARHTTLNVDRALKFLRRLASTREEYERLRKGLVIEAQVQAVLDHPNVVRLLDVGEHEGFIFLVMDYVRGRTLAELIHEKSQEGGHLAPQRIIELAIDVLSGLQYAHARGIVHRDLKPENILIDEQDRARIADFGLARLMEETGRQRHSRTGYLLGTPQYMAPEQVGGRGETYDHRCDVYSFGAVLYTMALGAPPFSDPDVWTVLRMHREEEPESLSLQVEGFPEELDEIIRKCLKKQPEDRYADATQVREALERCREKLLRVGTSEKKIPRRSRRTGLLAAGATGAAFVLAALIYSWRTQDPGAGANPLRKPEGLEVAKSASLTPAPEKEAANEPGPAPSPFEPERRSPPDSPPSKPPGPRETEKPLPPAVPTPVAPPLREKLAGYALSEAELAFVREVLDLFRKHRADLLAKSYASIQGSLETLERDRLSVARVAEPPPEKEYMAAQLRAASRILELAQGALLARLEELKQSKEQVSLALEDGTTTSGTVFGVEKGVVILTPREGGQKRVALASILTESLRGRTAPGTAQLALLALSGSVGASFREVVDLAGTRDELLFWIPVVVRLARLEAEAAAKAAAQKRKEGLPGQPGRERVASLARLLAEKREDVLRLFPHTKQDFEIVVREEEAIRLLHEGEYARVLALGPGTGAFPVAAEILLKRFEKDVEGAHDELLARTGWFGYTWGLFPDETLLKERQKYWDLDPEGNGSILLASGMERRLAMGTGAKRAPEGVLVRIAFEPQGSSPASSHWRFLVRSREGAPNYLKFDEASCALFRTKLEPGAADGLVATAPLPPKPNAERERVFALMPFEGQLHVFVDRQHLLTVPEADAVIPMQLSFGVTQGRAWIKSVKAKHSAPDDKDHR